MFCLDLETAGLESTAAVLSLAVVHFEPTDKLSYKNLLDSTLFIKFNLREQIKVYNRTTTPSTLDWWKKQCRATQVTSLLPSDSDVLAKEGIAQLRSWFKQFPGATKDMIWVRGSLDQPIFESLFRSTDEEPLVRFNQWRDVRTAIDCFYPNSRNGYNDVDVEKCPDFDDRFVIKHDPRHDICYDICQLFAGKVS
jgi:hypothetical protein